MSQVSSVPQVIQWVQSICQKASSAVCLPQDSLVDRANASGKTLIAQGAWRHPPNPRQPEGLWGSLGLPGVFGLPWAALGEPQSIWEGLDCLGLGGCLQALWA